MPPSKSWGQVFILESLGFLVIEIKNKDLTPWPTGFLVIEIKIKD